jgi:hypothetical protein|tara:strand:+ start:2953 stop:3054 length:102 start_codon:yes stop_codon:yes gene_type:complete
MSAKSFDFLSLALDVRNSKIKEFFTVRKIKYFS